MGTQRRRPRRSSSAAQQPATTPAPEPTSAPLANEQEGVKQTIEVLGSHPELKNALPGKTLTVVNPPDNTPTITYQQVANDGNPNPQVSTPASPSVDNGNFREGLEDLSNMNADDDTEVKRYDELIAALPQQESDEDKEKREKRAKRDRLFSAIGDGVSALSNLFFTTKGAPSQGEGVKSMSDAANEHYNRLAREAERRDNSILNKRLNYEKARAERIRVLTDQKMKVERLQNEVEKLRQQAYLAEKKGDVYEAQRLRLEADTRYKDLQSEGQRLQNLWYPSIQQSGIRQKDQGNRYNKPRATPIPRDDGQGGRPQQTPTQPAQPRTTPQQQVPQQNESERKQDPQQNESERREEGQMSNTRNLGW